MTRIIGVDMDGTIGAYGLNPGEYRPSNKALIATLRDRKVAIISNQGGVPFSYKSEKFPTAIDVANRINFLMSDLKAAGATLAGVYICTFHNNPSQADCDWARDEIEFLLSGFGIKELYVSSDKRDRKPEPGMLVLAGVSEYWGDSDEDRDAAKAAKVPFTRVPRYKGEAYELRETA